MKCQVDKILKHPKCRYEGTLVADFTVNKKDGKKVKATKKPFHLCEFHVEEVVRILSGGKPISGEVEYMDGEVQRFAGWVP